MRASNQNTCMHVHCFHNKLRNVLEVVGVLLCAHASSDPVTRPDNGLSSHYVE